MYCNNNNQIDCKVLNFQIEHRLWCEFPLSHSRIFLSLENASFNLLASFWYPPLGVGKPAQTNCIKCYQGWTQGGPKPSQPKEKKKKIWAPWPKEKEEIYFFDIFLFLGLRLPLPKTQTFSLLISLTQLITTQLKNLTKTKL